MFGKNETTRETANDAQQLQEFVSELTKAQRRIRAFIVSLMPGSPDVGGALQETNLTLWKSLAVSDPARISWREP